MIGPWTDQSYSCVDLVVTLPLRWQVMDSHRGARVSNIVEMLKPYSYEVLCNIDAFILVFCSVGLWLSSVPHIVQ